jgi:hypothetical protein
MVSPHFFVRADWQTDRLVLLRHPENEDDDHVIGLKAQRGTPQMKTSVYELPTVDDLLSDDHLNETRHPAVCIRTDRVHPILVDYFVFG